MHYNEVLCRSFSVFSSSTAGDDVIIQVLHKVVFYFRDCNLLTNIFWRNAKISVFVPNKSVQICNIVKVLNLFSPSETHQNFISFLVVSFYIFLLKNDQKCQDEFGFGGFIK